jgi:hypothetical protein
MAPSPAARTVFGIILRNDHIMPRRTLTVATLVAAACLSIAPLATARAQARPPARTSAAKETDVTHHARGTFEVKLAPQTDEGVAPEELLARLTIDKRFQGDLEATSKGQMLSASTAVKGSAGYVAIERVTGTLAGRRGSFVLQHSGTMTRGAPQLVISVVPDSGTDALEGIAGTMTIEIADGKHSYDFAYTLGGAP